MRVGSGDGCGIDSFVSSFIGSFPGCSKGGSRIGRRLSLAILLFGSVATLCIAGAELVLDCRSARDAITARLDDIGRRYAAPAAAALRSMDRREMDLIIQSIVSLTAIRNAAIREAIPSETGLPPAMAGTRPLPEAGRRMFPLATNCDTGECTRGYLYVEAETQDIYEYSNEHLLAVLGKNALEVVLISLLFLLIVHRMVTRRLLEISGAITDSPACPVGDCLHVPHCRDDDELGALAAAFANLGKAAADNEAALRLANNRMESILDNIPDMAWVKDAGGRYIAANRRLADVFGLHTPADIVGKTDFDLSPPEIATGYRAADARVLVTGVQERIEEAHVRADGSIFHIETLKTPLRDGNGKIAGVVGIARDITERKRIEQALADSERRFREMVEALPVGVFEDEPDRGCVYASCQWSRVTGLPVEEILGGGWRKAIHPDDLPSVDAVWTRNSGAGAIHQDEFRLCHVDGRITWVFVRAIPRFHPDGSLRGYVGSVMDISERKAMEIALSDKERRLSLLLESIPDGVAHTDRQGRITYVNAHVTSELGYTHDQLIGRTLEDVRGRNQLTLAVATAVRRAIREKAPNRMEVVWEGPSGKSTAEIRSVPELREDGEVSGVLTIGRDITERRLAEEGLRKAHAKLETMIRNLPGNIYRFRYNADNERHVLFFDGALERRITGKGFEGPVSTAELQARYHPDDARLLHRELPARLRAAGEILYTVRRILPDRSILWVRGREHVVERDGEDLITEGVSIDVTAEVMAREALEVSEAMFRNLVSLTAVGVAGFSPDGCCSYVNDRMLEKTGLAREEILGCHWTGIIHPADRIRAEANWAEALKRKTPYRDEYRVVRRTDSSVIWLLLQGAPQIDSEGEVVGWIIAAIDISERKAHELTQVRLNRVLRTLGAGNEALLRATDESSLYADLCQTIVETGGYRMVSVALLDADGEQANTLRTEAFAGHEDGYLSGIRLTSNDEALGHGPSGTAVRTGTVQVNRNTLVNPAMEPWRDEALKRGYLSSVSVPLASEGKVFGCLNIYAEELDAFAEDETTLLSELARSFAYTIAALRERRRREEMERRMMEAQKLEALGQLAGGVAHDFNNLLGAILGFARFIIEDCDREDPCRHHAARIVAAGERGKAIIGQILSFVRKDEINIEKIDLIELVEESIMLVNAFTPAITNLSIMANRPLRVTGNRDRVGQALINLLINAHHAVEQQCGRIDITIRSAPAATLAKARLEKEEGSLAAVWTDKAGVAHAVVGRPPSDRAYISITVADNGCGMDAALLSNAFNPFFTTKEKGRGTGLGLSMVCDTVRALEGCLLVDSMVGTGSSFEVILPVLDLSDSQQGGEAATQSRLSVETNPRILLVDDDPDFGEMLLTALERRGFEVSPCSDPRDVLAELDEHDAAWHVVVVDQRMPHMTGTQLIRELRARGISIPCILCSGYTEELIDKKSLGDAGVFAFFQKPVDTDELVCVLLKAIEKVDQMFNTDI